MPPHSTYRLFFPTRRTLSGTPGAHGAHQGPSSRPVSRTTCPRTHNPGLSGGGGKAAESRAKPAFCGEGRWEAGMPAGAHAAPWPAVGPPWPRPPAPPRLGLVKHVQLRRGQGRGRRQVRARCVCMTKSEQQVQNSDIHCTETTACPPHRRRCLGHPPCGREGWGVSSFRARARSGR